ncbi:MAG: hypothetical protein CL910_06440 [Deltaproteobacteria bacterium]|nr:hypothetical protein [Deltaproteobacteria bacterium]
MVSTAARTRAKVRKLKDKATEALRKGRTEDALAAYAKLEALEPEEGLWPQRAADVHRREGQPEEQTAALERAADRWAEGGFLLKAIAACKMVLELQPSHTSIQERLAELYASRGHTTQRPEEPASGSGLERGQPLEEIVLTEVVPSHAPEALELDEDSGGFAEIPLDWNHSGWLASEDSELPPELEVDPHAVYSRAQVEASLPAVPLFSSLDETALRQLIDGVELVSLAEGEMLFDEGDLGDALYVVTEGAVVPIARAEDGQPKRMAVIKEGEFFGETALLANQPRNARIEALVDTTLLAIDRGVMCDLLERDSAVLSQLLVFFRDRLIERLVCTSRFFSALPTQERRALARGFRFLEVEAESVLIPQGETSPALYVLLAGEAEALNRDGDEQKLLANLHAGHVFGEMSILLGDVAVCSCITRRKCWVLALGRKDVLTLMARHAPIHEAAMALAEARKIENARLLGGAVEKPLAIDASLGLV